MTNPFDERKNPERTPQADENPAGTGGPDCGVQAGTSPETPAPSALTRTAQGPSALAIDGGMLPPGSARFLVFYAFVISAARFIPIPLLDDLVPERLKQLMVRGILRHAKRTYSSSLLSPIWSDEGCLSGCLKALIWFPIKLVLFPIRKVLNIIQAIRNLSGDAVQTFLLGFALNRWLLQGRLAEHRSPNAVTKEAELLRKAFDAALQESNPALFASPLAAAWRGIGGLLRAGLSLARRIARLVGKNRPDHNGVLPSTAQAELDPLTDMEGNPGVPANAEPAVNAAVSAFEQLLGRPETREFLIQFAHHLDIQVQRLEAEATSTNR